VSIRIHPSDKVKQAKSCELVRAQRVFARWRNLKLLPQGTD
jgi:hypothetical protein